MKISQKLTIREVDSLDKYLHDITKNPNSKVLSKQEEFDLFQEYELTKNPKIQERIILSNLRWVISVAKQYTFKKAQVSDLINEGNIGLIEAFSTFDYKLGFRFISYATSYISKNIKSYLSNTISDVVLPANRNRVKKIISIAKSNLYKEGIFEPTLDQLVLEYNKLKDKVDPIISSLYLYEMELQNNGYVSSDTVLSDDNDSYTLESTFVSSSNYNADSNIKETEKKQEIINNLKRILNERESNVILHLFGIISGDEMTLEQTSQVLGYTRERVGQIKDIAIKKLKNHKQLLFSILGSSKDNINQNKQYHENI